MASFGLDLDGPLLPNVDAYVNPTKDDDVHRIALNAVVSFAYFLNRYKDDRTLSVSGMKYCTSKFKSIFRATAARLLIPQRLIRNKWVRLRIACR